MSDAMVYAGRINALNGEPGGGKTWVALHTCAEAMRAGHNVVYIDLEDHPGSTVARLKALGCTREEVTQQMHYIRPTGPLMPESMECLEQRIREHSIALVVIDSIGELMALQDVKPNDDDAVAKLYRGVLRHLADMGPAVLLLDHVPKNNEHAPLYAIGSQRKKAAIDGAAYMVETIKPFASETPGKVVLRTAKDRNGNFVVGSVAAEIDVTPSAGGSKIALDVRAPEMTADGSSIRQTVNMGKVSTFLQGCADASASRSEIEHGAGVHVRHITSVLTSLVDEGWVLKYAGGKGKADRYCHLVAFNELQQPPNQTVESCDTF
jgi:hypothetical protein